MAAVLTPPSAADDPAPEVDEPKESAPAADSRAADRRRVALAGLTFVLAIAVLSYAGPFAGRIEQLEGALLDVGLNLRGPLQPSARIAAVEIDQAAVEEFGRFPFDRAVFARAVRALDAAGVAVVLIDVPFIESTVAGDDAEFASALSSATTAVVLGHFFYTDERGREEGADGAPLAAVVPTSLGSDHDLLGSTGAQPPLPLFERAAASSGFLNLRGEGGAIVRRAQLVIEHEGQLHASAALQAATLLELGAGGSGSPLFVGGSGARPELSHATGAVPMDGSGAALYNYVGPSSVWPSLGLAELIGRAESGDVAGLRDLLQGKVVVLGPSAVGLWDRRDSPFELAGPAWSLHATVLDNLIEDRFLKRSPALLIVEWLLLLLLGGLSAVTVARAPVWLSATVCGALTVGLLAVGPLALMAAGAWFRPATPAIGVAGAFVLGSAVRLAGEVKRRREEEVLRGQITALFGRYVTPELVHRIVASPESVALGGQRLRVTIMFSDIRGFTSLSEGMEPQELAGLLSRYLDGMSRAIVDHAGIVDKYLGDGIMALFGAPLPDPEHPAHACDAALAKLEALDQFNERCLSEGLIDQRFEVGIGLNTGFAAVGNLGSELRMDYTALGDEVNLAARLEGLTKAYGVACLISDATRQGLGDRFLLRELDEVRVKGRSAAVTIYELVGRSGPRPRWIDRYEAALAAYRDRDMAGAESLCLELLATRPGDGPGRFLLQRIEERRSRPADGDWDTIHDFKVK